jgi:predicted patatin/cPLA2 family phospholipase
MKGIIDVGGGLRDIYGAGVFDFCLDHSITFDYGIGVSAGSGNMMSFLAGQRGRTFGFYHFFAFRKEYMSAGNFLRNRSYIDLNYIYGTLSNSDGEFPFEYEKFEANPMQFKVVATDAETCEPKYFDKSEILRDRYDIIKASCAIPFVCKPVEIDGREYFDGGVADPVPLKKAYEDGCDFVTVILTLPRDFRMTGGGKDNFAAKRLHEKYPNMAYGLYARFDTYNAQINYLEKMEREGRARIIAPDDLCGMTTLSKDRSKMRMLYEKGYEDAKVLLE